MAGGRLWTASEDAFLKRCVEVRGLSSRELIAAYHAEWGHSRSGSAIRKRRSDLGLEQAAATHTTEDVRPPPDSVKGELRVEDREGEMVATIYGASACQTVDELIERAGIDLNVWETFGGVAKRYYTPMKIDDQPVVVESPFTEVRFRKAAENLFAFTPHEINITAVPTSKAQSDGFTSIHVADDHVPYHDERVWNIIYQVMDDVRPEVVVHHGDLLDCEQISRYPKDPANRRSLAEEITIGSTHLATMSAIVPDARKIFLQGNHEDRVRRVIWTLADQRAAGELLTLPDVADALRLERLLGIEDIGWESVSYTGAGGANHVLLFDRLICKHGDVVRKDSGASARAECSKYSKGGISGHTHRQGIYFHRDYNGVMSWVELGMCGRVRNDYVAHADWQQGFLVLQWSPDAKRYAIELVTITDGECYYRGRRYTG